MSTTPNVNRPSPSPERLAPGYTPRTEDINDDFNDTAADSKVVHETTGENTPVPPTTPGTRIAFQGDLENPKITLKASDCEQELGYAFTSEKKIWILVVMFLAQCSMNLNASLYSNAIGGISKEFNVREDEARWGAAAFLIAYAFGCELWAPWSEEYGRKIVLQLSLALVSLSQLMVVFAPNFATLMAGRVLGGLWTAGGSVTLAVITDIYNDDVIDFQYANAFIVFSSVGGSIIGPIAGGFIQAKLDWKWCIWVQFIFGVFVQVLHVALCPETRSTVIMDRIAKSRRKRGEHVVGPTEDTKLEWKKVGQIWMRPFGMFFTEAIVLTMSLLSGFADALIFMSIQSFGVVYKQWDFGPIALGLTFVPLLIGYLIAYVACHWFIRRNFANRQKQPQDERIQYEDRLMFLLWTAPCLPIGLLIFAFTTAAPGHHVHWIGSMVSAAIIGIANYAIYQGTIDYTLKAYGPYAASATGGNGFARDALAGILTPVAIQLYKKVGDYPMLFGTIILCGISIVLTASVYAVYYYGPRLREKSPFAVGLSARKSSGGIITSVSDEFLPGSRVHSTRNSLQLPRELGLDAHLNSDLNKLEEMDSRLTNCR